MDSALIYIQMVLKALAIIPRMRNAESVKIRKDYTNLVKF